MRIHHEAECNESDVFFREQVGITLEDSMNLALQDFSSKNKDKLIKIVAEISKYLI